ncbi:NAD(P)H-quinone oxidoreductase [Aestuariibacter sp. A3R04]|uniref:NAD(P)H-quinone oxidoreductase n=1 Tax=Aestuariibacter sp. A3R04 TaxID=2841571 RepID=UPI001C082B48|nr:NAD(P)H-quinone oxidoreductase [Aestuariibacter sp. A3R04]MBU3022699.1 NAD(P)H-quinone oxidoreductase [Aestuariibacter sp. A3R04]
MKYVTYEAGKGIPSLRLETTSLPALGKGEVTIAVEAFGVNRADTLQRQGKYPAPPGESDILGLEVSGEITSIAEGVDNWSVGDKVCALVPGGGYAEFVNVDARHVLPVPTSVSLTEAAGLTEVFLTAWQALTTFGSLKTGDRALIHAGASGVGLAALQLCRFKGVETATTASSEKKLAVCREQGAHLAINYKEQEFDEVIKSRWPVGVDFILDVVGGDYINRNLKVLKRDGMMIYLAMLAGRYADKLDMALLLAKRARIQGSTLRNRSDNYKAALVDDFVKHAMPGFANGALRVNVDTVLPVGQIQRAHQLLEDNATMGKVIVTW